MNKNATPCKSCRIGRSARLAQWPRIAIMQWQRVSGGSQDGQASRHALTIAPPSKIQEQRPQLTTREKQHANALR
jgi:hypothetical protein